MKRRTRTMAIWALQQEKCEVVGDKVRVKSDGRIVHNHAQELISDGIMDSDCQLMSGVKPKHLSLTEIKKLLSTVHMTGRWRLRGTFAEGTTGGFADRHKILYLIQIGFLQIDPEGWITPCTSSTVTLIKRPATA